MRSIGLTGGIASGKSTASAVLAELGACVIDADRLGHQVYVPGSVAFDAVVDTFGLEIVSTNGTIDRGALGDRVFSDPKALKRLTDIVWPTIRHMVVEELLRLTETGADVVLIEAAVMIEAGWKSLVDEVWVMSVPPSVARQRLMERNSLSAAEADKRINAQLGNVEREAHADVIIDSNCSLDRMHEMIFNEWVAFTGRVSDVD